ncbi:MAG TPA: WD40 repeat domain-containing protein, partial [Gemmataceae bacterium]|nr:WD40 repeat domain-containing protein [Gemmataceae bacterium]
MRILQNTRERLVLGVGFGPDGRTLVAGGSGGFDVWDLPASKHRFVGAQDSGAVFAFVVDQLGRWLYFSEHRAGGYRYDLKTGETQRFPGDPYDHHMISIATSSDGSQVAVSRGGAGHNRLECWTIGAGGRMTLAWSVPGPTETVSFHGLAFSPDGSKIASVEELPWRGARTPPHPTVLRESLTGKQLSEFGGVPHTLYVQTMFMSDGRQLIVWDNEQFSVWDV